MNVVKCIDGLCALRASVALQKLALKFNWHCLLLKILVALTRVVFKANVFLVGLMFRMCLWLL